MSSSIEIKQISFDEAIEIVYPLTTYAFNPSPPLFDRDRWVSYVRQRKNVTFMALFESGLPVSCAAASPMTQNVRCHLCSLAGIWAVATHPAARRKGYSRRLLGHLLQHMRDQGFVVSGLYPFRESFYEKLGYVSFPLPLIVEFDSANLSSLIDYEVTCQVNWELIADAYPRYRSYLEGLRHVSHGMALFDFFDQGRVDRNDLWHLDMTSEDKIQAVMHYAIRGEKLGKFVFDVTRFYYQRPQERYALLNWIARHIDQVGIVKMDLPPYEEPEAWLMDLKAQVRYVGRAPMARILEVVKLSGLSVGPGGFSIHLLDPLCTWNQGDWTFESHSGSLVVKQGGEPDFTLTIQGLSALIYGTHDPDEFSLRRWGDPDQNFIDILRQMFPIMKPYLHEKF